MSKIGKRELARAVRNNAAQLIVCFDIEELLGEDLHSQICDDHSLLEYVEHKQKQLADAIRGKDTQ